MVTNFISNLPADDVRVKDSEVLFQKLSSVLTRLSSTTVEQDSNRHSLSQLYLNQQSGPFIDFLKPGRLFIRQGYLRIHCLTRKVDKGERKPARKTMKRHFFLCNDLLVEGELKNDGDNSSTGKSLKNSSFKDNDGNSVEPFHVYRVHSLYGSRLIDLKKRNQI